MPPTEVMLRAAHQSDGPAIGAIKVETWRRAYASILPAAALDGLDAAGESAEWGAYAGDTPPDDRLIDRYVPESRRHGPPAFSLSAGLLFSA